MMTATLKNDVGPEDFGISTMDAEKARHYAAFLVAAERERCAKIVDMPPGTEAWEVIGGEEGLTMLRELAALIRSGGQP